MRFVPWEEQASVLGIPVRTHALPTTTTCPLCHGESLRVYNDDIEGMPQTFCKECGFAGSMIELAARLWDMPPEEASVRMNALGVNFFTPDCNESEISTVKEIFDLRERVNKLWEDSKDFLLSGVSPCVNKLRQQFFLTGDNIPKERWKRGPGSLFGAYPCKLLNKLFHTVHTKKLFINSTGAWSEALVMPRFDRPGHICAFDFIGRNGTDEDKITRMLTDNKKKNPELGLFGMESALAETPHGNVVTAMKDNMLLLRMQVRHANSSGVPLPLVTWRDDGLGCTTRSWECLHDRKIVFWADSIDGRLIRQAQLADGYISTIGPENRNDRSIGHFMGSNPGDLLKRVHRAARPWREAVSKWASSVPDGKLKSAIQQMQRRGVDVNSLARQLDSRSRDRMLSLIMTDFMDGDRSVQFSTHISIVERPSGWYADDSRNNTCRLICNAVLRIETVFFKGDVPYYRGRVIFKGEPHHFEVIASRIDKRCYEWMDSFVKQKRAGFLYVETPYSRRIAIISKLFHEPDFEDYE